MNTLAPKNPIMVLRGFACLSVVVYHLHTPGSWLVINGTNFSFITGLYGAMGVYIFYLISGYTIGYGFFSGRYALTLPSLFGFYRNRLLRIAPAYYLCLLASIFIFYPQRDISNIQLLKLFTFTANFNYVNNLPFQALLVIISTEMQFYLVAPICFALLSRMVQKIHPLGAMLAILVSGALVRFAFWSYGLVPDLSLFMQRIYVTVWGMMDYFLFGMLVSYLVIRRTRVFSYGFPVLFVLWLLWVNYVNFFPVPYQTYAMHHLFILPPTLCLVIGWYIIISSQNIITLQSPSVDRILTLLMHPKTFLEGIGYISFGLYLYHYAVYDVLFLSRANVPDSVQGFFIRFITVVPIAIIWALASYQFVERPLLSVKSR